MREEYNSVLSTPTEADKIGRFGRYRYIGETQISARNIGPARKFYLDLGLLQKYCFMLGWLALRFCCGIIF